MGGLLHQPQDRRQDRRADQECQQCTLEQVADPGRERGLIESETRFDAEGLPGGKGQIDEAPDRNQGKHYGYADADFTNIDIRKVNVVDCALYICINVLKIRIIQLRSRCCWCGRRSWLSIGLRKITIMNWQLLNTVSTMRINCS